MIDRLHDALPYLEHLPPETQEEAATYIEALIETLKFASVMHPHIKSVQDEESISELWQDPFGAWSDLSDTMLDELYHLRHLHQPTPQHISL
jgi:hypothetical protein